MDKANLTFFENELSIADLKEYRFKPSTKLRSFIEEFMIIECANAVKLETMPSTSVSFNFILKGEVKMRKTDVTEIELPKAVAFGVFRKSQEFTFHNNALLFVTKFKDGSAASILKDPISQLENHFISLSRLFNEEKISCLKAQLKAQSSYLNMVNLMEVFLNKEMDPLLNDMIIKRAVQQIIEEKGMVSIKSLTMKLNISRDVFEKRFKKKVGTTPKQYANIIRFKNIFNDSINNKSLTEIALRSGYYDQSHFIREFKSFTGKLPSKALIRHKHN